MRLALQDHLQAHPFWLMDVALMDGGAPILTPLFGFATITAPEITIEVQEIVEGNWLWKRKVLKKRADVGNITLTRGATFHDTDFYSWIINALAGENLTKTLGESVAGLFGRNVGFNPRRTLLLLHFFAHNPLQLAIDTSFEFLNNAVGGVTRLFGGNSDLLPQLGPLDTISNVSRLVPARAFVLHGCLPVRYKSGTDYDASSGQVSIVELELAVEQMEQVVLSA